MIFALKFEYLIVNTSFKFMMYENYDFILAPKFFYTVFAHFSK